MYLLERVLHIFLKNSTNHQIYFNTIIREKYASLIATSQIKIAINVSQQH